MRNYNQDYFKVGGTSAEDRDAGGRARASLTKQAAQLKREAPRKGAVRAPAAKVSGRTGTAAPTPTARKPPPPPRAPKAAARVETRPPRAKAAKAKAPAAVVHEFHEAKPKVGKKRRSVKKKHDLEVTRQIEEQIEEAHVEGAYHAGVVEQPRGEERPPATVSELRPRARVLPARPEDRGPTTAPPTFQDVMQLLQRAGHLGREALEIAWHLARSPTLVVRLLRGMREQEA